jgi:hypothetical protein
MQPIKATVYNVGVFGVTRTEIRALEITVGKYAQYSSAVSVKFIAKGKRSPQGYWLTYKPELVILEGHDHMAPDGPMEPVGSVDANGVTATRSRYASCDPRWAEDFNRQLAAYVERTGAKILHDFRGFDTSAVRVQEGA